MAQTNLSTKQKQTHRHREETCGCQGGGGSGKRVETRGTNPQVLAPSGVLCASASGTRAPSGGGARPECAAHTQEGTGLKSLPIN